MESSLSGPAPGEPEHSPSVTGSSSVAQPRPSNNAGWAVVSLLFFWPLAFSAFHHAFEVYPLWAGGDTDGALYASRRVRKLGQLSLWIFGALLLLAIVLYAIAAIVLISHGGDGGQFHHDRGD
ncbi:MULTISPECIES: CD225/dispanin family protein [unclassified Rhodococcus (in: high G+C Gram-positive bacteria)]|uniref:CD225/dispanin family protein n=1 Tax=unclassified Rhodococcus (in: high G+C Gram-positive bacteria) TaxID=192944 RepID=UPI0016397A9B|nr:MULTISPECIES: CD225/dispanin family protein [unclassified Rhodococcus (in: high G+C Gram-positive bacteria)]MBC2644557.1 CD225/dispanin family protein [Rhodococcus sp. 3A]MBC2897754.1 CD225/dispanin family protein [Rhodococcus sp. 4CII]